MPERTLNFGADATDADYQIRDTSETGGDLVIEHLPTGATFEYDATENAWVPTDPIGTDARPVPGVVSDSVSTNWLNGGVTGSKQVARIFGERIESKPIEAGSEFITGLGDYNTYVLELNGLEPLNPGNDAQLQVSTDGGSTWESGASAYEYAVDRTYSDGTQSISSSNGDSFIRLINDMNVSSYHFDATITFSRPADEAYTQFRWEGTGETSGNPGSTGKYDGGGSHLTAEAINGVRVTSGGDISGYGSLYGVMD